MAEPRRNPEALTFGGKMGIAVGKTNRGKGTKWMVRSTVKVFRWEFGWKAPPQVELCCGTHTRRNPHSAPERTAE